LNHQVGKVGLRHAAVGARAALKNVNSRLSGQVEAAEAMQRLERDARDSRGEMRKSKLRAWCQVRHRLTKNPSLHAPPPLLCSHGEQQLQAVPRITRSCQRAAHAMPLQ
jgi:hypothetical protein